MQIYILIGLIFILICGLFALIIMPEWVNKIRSKLSIDTNNQIQEGLINTAKSNEENNQNSKEENQPDIERFNDKKNKIYSQLNTTKYLFSDPESMRSYDLSNRIDNIIDYLKPIDASEEFILDLILNNLHRIDFAYPEPKDDDSDQKFELNEKRNKITSELASISNLLFHYNNSNKSYSEDIKEFYKNALSEISEELRKFRNLKGILENSATTKVYENAKKKYSLAFYTYLALLIFTIYGVLHFSLYIIQEKAALKELGMDIYDYWTIKITCIFIFATIITFLLKQIAHYQKKRDEAERTTLELKALPSYLADLEAKDATNLRKDLAPKYFGKSNDNSTLNEIGNIVTEQLKTSSDVVKSSAEIIKSLKPKP